MTEIAPDAAIALQHALAGKLMRECTTGVYGPAASLHCPG